MTSEPAPTVPWVAVGEAPSSVKRISAPAVAQVISTEMGAS